MTKVVHQWQSVPHSKEKISVRHPMTVEQETNVQAATLMSSHRESKQFTVLCLAQIQIENRSDAPWPCRRFSTLDFLFSVCQPTTRQRQMPTFKSPWVFVAASSCETMRPLKLRKT
jgi:hypothetical protein